MYEPFHPYGHRQEAVGNSNLHNRVVRALKNNFISPMKIRHKKKGTTLHQTFPALCSARTILSYSFGFSFAFFFAQPSLLRASFSRARHWHMTFFLFFSGGCAFLENVKESFYRRSFSLPLLSLQNHSLAIWVGNETLFHFKLHTYNAIYFPQNDTVPSTTTTTTTRWAPSSRTECRTSARERVVCEGER